MFKRFSAMVFPFAILVFCSANHATSQDDSKQQSPRAIAIKGTPEIDGKLDDAWKKAPRISVAKAAPALLNISEDEMATAKVRLMWDEEHIYAFWQVKDPALSADADDEWSQDSVELFLDENLARSSFYEEDDAQYRCNFEGMLSGQGAGYDEESFKATAKKSKTGYTVEMAITVHDVKLTAGNKMGIELQVNDSAGSGQRDAVAKWNHTEDDSWESTASFGTLVLKETHEMKNKGAAKKSKKDDVTPAP